MEPLAVYEDTDYKGFSRTLRLFGDHVSVEVREDWRGLWRTRKTTFPLAALRPSTSAFELQDRSAQAWFGLLVVWAGLLGMAAGMTGLIPVNPFQGVPWLLQVVGWICAAWFTTIGAAHNILAGAWRGVQFDATSKGDPHLHLAIRRTPGLEREFDDFVAAVRKQIMEGSPDAAVPTQAPPLRTAARPRRRDQNAPCLAEFHGAFVDGVPVQRLRLFYDRIEFFNRNRTDGFQSEVDLALLRPNSQVVDAADPLWMRQARRIVAGTTILWYAHLSWSMWGEPLGEIRETAVLAAVVLPLASILPLLWLLRRFAAPRSSLFRYRLTDGVSFLNLHSAIRARTELEAFAALLSQQIAAAQGRAGQEA